jgi:MtrB/PioB family decaheme-associated outer membrane protein
MRKHVITLIGALAVTLPAITFAQSTLPVPTEPRDTAAAAFSGRAFGDIEFGGRFSDINGDPARYQRYRDLRDGPFAKSITVNRRTADWTVFASAENVGYRDQRYFAEYRNVGKLQVSFLWDQIPLFISSDTRTLYTQAQPGVFRLEDAIQSNNQAGATTIRSYADQAARFDTRTRRDIGALDVVLNATRDLDVLATVTSTARDGAIPYGAPFGFNNLVELPVPIDQRTTDAKTTLEWANRQGMISVGWDGSWFDNHIETLVWDNPLKITDSPSYSNAYSDGKGPSQARMALWPSNTHQYVHATGSVTTPGRGRAVAYVAIGESRQNADLIAHTINTQIPEIPLERTTAEAELRNTMLNFQYSAHPINRLGVVARYRYADVDNRTPHFETLGRVRFDGVYDDAENSPEPEAYSIKRKTFDVDGTVRVLPFTALKLGYTNAIVDRTFRIFEETTENTFRVSVDATGNQYVSVRALYENASREGDMFDAHLLEEFGEQSGMRHPDVANRDRERVTLIANTNPTDVFGFTASIGVGRDDYPDSGFGLQSYDSNQYSFGFDVIPNDRVGFNLVWAWEDYASLTRSRSAVPAPDPQFFDPRRDWLMDYDGTVKNIDATLDLAEIAPRTDLRVNVNWNDAVDTYLYVLVPNSVLPTPQQLDPVINELLRSSIDLNYRLSNQVRLGASYWYENYKTQDFALGPLTMSDIALPVVQPGLPVVATNSLLLGYLYRPYTAHTGMVRLTYLW